jgi:hypothetical protein
MKLSKNEVESLGAGLARIYRGRVVPIQKGGATYTPKTLITSKTLGNGSANVATAQYNNTGTGESIARSLTSMGQAGATGQVTWEMGVTGVTSIQQQRFIDAYVLTASIPYFVNGWYTVPVNSFLSAWGSTATVTGYAAGVLSV